METMGALIDKLSVVNIRIWFAEDIKRNKEASDKEVADACKITNVANSQRNDLIQEIDEMMNNMIVSGMPQRLYQQGATKIYGKDGPGFERIGYSEAKGGQERQPLDLDSDALGAD
jgi:hypothetical protein